MMIMSLYNDIKFQYDCLQDRLRTISGSFKELFSQLYMFSNLTEYNIKKSVLCKTKHDFKNSNLILFKKIYMS